MTDQTYTATTVLAAARMLADQAAPPITCTRSDLFIRTTMPLTTYSDGTTAPAGTTVTMTFPVVGWAGDGTPLVAIAGGAKSTANYGRMQRADSFERWDLCVSTAVTRTIPTADPTDDVVEVIPGSSEQLTYTLPTGERMTGVVPLWGRRGDGSLVALVTAEVVPTVRSIMRDEDGEITGVVEQ